MFHTPKTQIPILQWVVVILMLLPTLLFSQITVSTISGSVKDESGNPVAGAEVVATNLPTGSQYKTVSGKSGLYYIANVNPGGPYRINTIINGKDVVAEIANINVGEEGVATLTPAMSAFANSDSTNGVKVTNLSEVVVNSQNTGINKSGPSTNFDSKQINAISSVNRSVSTFMYLNPYVSGNFNFAGRDGRYNNFTVDGASMNNSFGLSSGLAGGGIVQPISLDAVEQISVQISPFDVRQTNFTGGTMNLVTKNGTNTLHGSAYVFYRNQALNGTQIGDNKLTLNKSTNINYGINLGGPILKNKLFYFVSFEGDYSQTPLSTMVPNTGSGASNESRVTAADLNTVSNYLLENYGYKTGGTDYSKLNTPSSYKALARIDWNINKDHKLTVRYNFVQGVSFNLPSTSRAGSMAFISNSRMAATPNATSGYSFWNSTYGFKNTVQSFVLDLKSNFGNKFSNQLLATYAIDNQVRTSPGDQIFPMVDIMNPLIGTPISGSLQDYISFGNELFTPYNAVYGNTFSVQDNFTALLGKHTVLAGVGFDLYNYANSFAPAANGSYRYNTWDDFVNHSAPSAYALSYTYNGSTNFAPASSFGKPTLYIQDEWKILDNFKLTGSIRMDIPLYFTKLINNPAIDAVNASNPWMMPGANPTDPSTSIKMNYNKWPSSTPLFSPRISFVYDVLKDKSLIIRGGVGVFTGLVPFLWMVGLQQNSGTIYSTYTATNDVLSKLPFNPNPADQLRYLQNAGVLNLNMAMPSTIVAFDKNFKLPQVLRINLAIDYTFAKDFTLTVEGLYTKDINQLLVYNAGISAPVTTNFYDNRAAWWDPVQLAQGRLAGATPFLVTSPQNTNAIYITNTNKGQGVTFNVGLNKKFSKNWNAGVSYAYTYYEDVTPNSGSQILSIWTGTNNKNGANYLQLGQSSYAIPGKVTAYISYTADYAKYFGTSVTLSYITAPYSRYSYRYQNSLVGDNGAPSLLYIPKYVGDGYATGTGSDIQFTALTNSNGTYTAAQQYKDFWDYVNQDKYLSSLKNMGGTTERNAGIMPWEHKLNFRLLQNFYFYTGKVKHTIQISYEIVNVLNLLNKNWGSSYSVNSATFGDAVVLNPSGYNPVSKQPTFTFNESINSQQGGLAKYNGQTFIPFVGLSSTWAMNLGIRYIF